MTNFTAGKNLFFLILQIFLGAASPAHGDEVQTPDAQSLVKIEVVEKDAMILSWFNRSDRRKYAEKIRNRSISFDELKDYIKKRGNVHHFKSYDAVENFFVGPREIPLLNYFVAGETSDSRIDRVQSLELLLKNGASPNTQSEATMWIDTLAPVLYAAYFGDAEAFKLFLQNGADLNLRETKYAGSYGPALAVARNAEIADLIVKAGYNPQAKDSEGRNLLELFFYSALSGERILERLQWMKAQGIPFHSDVRKLAEVRKRAQDLHSIFESTSPDSFGVVRHNPEQAAIWAKILKLLE